MGPQGPAGPPGPGTKTISGIVAGNGATIIGSGFTVSRTAVGDYTVTFPAGTWTFPAPVVVVSAQQSVVGVSVVANLGNMTLFGNGSATIQILLSTTAGPSTPVDAVFAFNASAPLTAGASALRSSGARRVTLGKPVARSAARSRKAH